MHIALFDLPKHITQHLSQLNQSEFNVTPLSQFSDASKFEIVLTSLEQAKKFSEKLRSLESVVLIYTTAEKELSHSYKIAKEAGAFMVISDHDLQRIEVILHEAHEEMMNNRKATFKKGKTIGLISTKGGVGKTFLSHQLAHQLSSYVYTDLILIDGGVPYGSTRSLLNLHHTQSWQVLRPLLKNGKDLTVSRLKAQIVKTHFSFDLLSSPHSFSEKPLLSMELKHLTEATKQQYSLTIVDLPTVQADQIVQYSNLFDLVILVGTPDPNSIIQTIELQKTLQSQNVIIVNNMIEPALDSSLVKAIEQKLERAKCIDIEYDQEAVKLHQRNFKVFTDETLVLTQQLKNFAKEVFFKISTR